MRRMAISMDSALVGFGLLATLAPSTFHLAVVNEVMLASASGDPSVQFVELLDRGGPEEPLTPLFAPYQLVVYDARRHDAGSADARPERSARGRRGGS